MPSVNLIIVQILNGLTIGLSIALIAMGLTLVFGTMDIVNFAHGEFYMIGAYGLFVFVPMVGNFWITLLAVSLGVAMLAAVMEQLTLRPIRDRDPLDSLIVTFGFVLIFQQLALEWFGGQSKSMEAPVSGTVTLYGDLVFPKVRLVVLLGGVVVIVATWLFLERTRLGILIRATAQDIETARTLGVPSNRINVLVFAIGAFLASIAAGFLAPIRNVSPTMGAGVVIDAFIVIIVGGLGSIPGAVVAALLIGLIESLSVLWLPPFATDVVVFGLLIVVLLIRPEGLFGTQTATE